MGPEWATQLCLKVPVKSNDTIKIKATMGEIIAAHHAHQYPRWTPHQTIAITAMLVDKIKLETATYKCFM